MKKNIIVANWKMNGSKREVLDWLKVLLDNDVLLNAVDTIFLPPLLYLPMVASILQNESLGFGAQNICFSSDGAYTGEVSYTMLDDWACEYILIGHSERRHIFKEDNNAISKKLEMGLKSKAKLIFCIGETIDEKNSNKTMDALAKQLVPVLNCVENTTDISDRIILAYEPVWSIGTGVTPSPLEINNIHSNIKKILLDNNGNKFSNMPILYGGSVSPQNAEEIFSLQDVDGGLVGGASLDANKFLEIIKCMK